MPGSKPVEAGRPVVIVDIDGTVADVHHRLHHIEGRGRKNWKGFFFLAVALRRNYIKSLANLI